MDIEIKRKVITINPKMRVTIRKTQKFLYMNALVIINIETKNQSPKSIDVVYNRLA